MFDMRFRLDTHSVEPVSRNPEYLLGLRSSVATDGAGTIFDVAITNQRPFRLHIPLAGIGTIFSEVRQAQALMQHRQRQQFDGSAERLLELCGTALRPRHLEVLRDPASGDHLFVTQFDDHAPIVLRVGAAQLVANLETTLASVRHAWH